MHKRSVLTDDRVNKHVTILMFVCLQVKNGHVEHVMDKEIKYYAIEVEGRDME